MLLNENKGIIKINLTDIQIGDVFSEESHYVCVSTNPFRFKHLESDNVVDLDKSYVEDLLTTADQFFETIEVGLEDKLWTQKQIDEAKKKNELPSDTTIREGDLKLKGIRSIWADIHTTKVWSISFNKKGKELTKKAFNAAKEKQIKDALTNISTGQVTLENAFKFIQENPINPVEKGEVRTLRGFKVQFSSINGVYDVVDMDILDPDKKGLNLRKVNVNEINWLVIDGKKYVVNR